MKIHKFSDVKTKSIGKNTIIWQFSVILPSAILGSDCNICSHCFIENDVTIGDRVTIKNGVKIFDSIEIEDDVFIGPNVTFTNDLYPKSERNFKIKKKFPKTKICKGASIGAGSIILPGITIGEFSLVGAGSLVDKNIKNNSIFYGNPAKFKRKIKTEP